MAKPTKYGFYRPHERVTFDNVDPTTGEVDCPSMTKQEFKNECDINNVIKQFKPHHMAAMLQANLNSGLYEDLPDDTDYQAALHLIRDAEKTFNTVPSKVRERFGHDPSAFFAFVNNPANLEELRSLGLAKPEPPAPTPVEVIIKAPPGSSSPTGGAGGTGG